MHGVQRLMSRRDVIVSTVTAGGAFAVLGVPRLPPAGSDGGLAGVRLPASPVATPVADVIEIAIEAIGLRFSPSEISIPARTPVRILLTNGSRVYHDLVIPQLGRRTRRIGPGETTDLLIQAEPGAYDFHCSIQSHHQAGMGGTITAR